MRNVFLLILAIIFCPAVAAETECSPADESAIRAVLSAYETQFNAHNLRKLTKFYADDYADADNLDKNSIIGTLSDFFRAFPDATTNDTITAIKATGKKATVSRRLSQTGHSASAGMISSEPGEMHSNAEVETTLRKTEGTWKITYEKTVTEETTVDFGLGKDLTATLALPHDAKPGTIFMATLETSPIAYTLMGSIISNRITYPIQEPKDAWRAISNRKLERQFEANTDGHNERIEATAAMIDPDKDGMVGLKHISRRVNVNH